MLRSHRESLVFAYILATHVFLFLLVTNSSVVLFGEEQQVCVCFILPVY